MEDRQVMMVSFYRSPRRYFNILEIREERGRAGDTPTSTRDNYERSVFLLLLETRCRNRAEGVGDVPLHAETTADTPTGFKYKRWL